MDNKAYIEELIDRVRNIIVYEQKSFNEIVDELSKEYQTGDVILAWHAAKILLKDVGIEVEG